VECVSPTKPQLIEHLKDKSVPCMVGSNTLECDAKGKKCECVLVNFDTRSEAILDDYRIGRVEDSRRASPVRRYKRVIRVKEADVGWGKLSRGLARVDVDKYSKRMGGY